MADTKISALPAASLPLAGTEVLPIVQSSTTKKVATSDMLNFRGVTAGQYLRGDGTNIVLSGIQANDVPTLNQNTTGTAALASGLTGTPNISVGTLAATTGTFGGDLNVTGAIHGNGGFINAASGAISNLLYAGGGIGIVGTQTAHDLQLFAGNVARLILNNSTGAATFTSSVSAALGFASTNTSTKTLDLLQTLSGTTPAGVTNNTNSHNEIKVVDTCNAPANLLDTFLIQTDLNSGANGGRNAFRVLANMNADMSASYSGSIPVAVGVVGQAFGNVSSTHNARVYGGNFYAGLLASKTGYSNLTGAEFNTNALTAVAYKTGIQIVSVTGDVQGTIDAAVSIGKDNTSYGYTVGLLFSNQHGAFPIPSAGTLIQSTGSTSVATGIDFSSHTFSGYSLNMPNFFVTGGGNLQASGTGTFGSTVITVASSTSRAGLRLGSGTAPTSPTDGDMWYDGTNVKFRVGGTTKTFTLV